MWFILIFFLFTSSKGERPAHVDFNFKPKNYINMSDSILYKYVSYNHWANEKIAEWLSNLDEEVMYKEIESSFKSLAATVKHIWSAEMGWLQVIKEEPWDNSVIIEFSGDTKTLLKSWLSTSRAFRDHILTLEGQQFREKKKASKEREFTIEEIVHHTMNHSTYHRGQLITMGRQAGLVNPPRTDYIYYIRL